MQLLKHLLNIIPVVNVINTNNKANYVRCVLITALIVFKLVVQTKFLISVNLLSKEHNKLKHMIHRNFLFQGIRRRKTRIPTSLFECSFAFKKYANTPDYS